MVYEEFHQKVFFQKVQKCKQKGHWRSRVSPFPDNLFKCEFFYTTYEIRDRDAITIHSIATLSAWRYPPSPCLEIPSARVLVRWKDHLAVWSWIEWFEM